VTILFTRIFSNSWAGIQNNINGLSIPAINNWWGCNGGPGATGCDSIYGFYSTVDANPWLVLNATIPTGQLNIDQVYPVTANLWFNSDGADTSSTGSITDLVKAFFTELLGIFTPTEKNFTDGLVSSDYTPETPGTDTICIAVDNEEVCDVRTVKATYKIYLPFNIK
jgi:hypothetical protein